MSKSTEGKRVDLVAGSTVRSPAFSAERSRGRVRKAKNTFPHSVTPQVDRTDPATLMRQRRGLQSAKDLDRPVTESVESLAKYRPRSRKYEVSLTFSGDAGTALSELMRELGVSNANEVVKLSIALLVSARGKEILLRDPKTAVVEIAEFPSSREAGSVGTRVHDRPRGSSAFGHLSLS